MSPPESPIKSALSHRRPQFSAVLGLNPIQHLLRPSGALALPPTASQQILTGRESIPSLLSGPFHHGLIVVFAVAAALARACRSRLAAAGRPLRSLDGS